MKMKNLNALSILVSLLFSSTLFAQYQVGVEVVDTIYYGAYYSQDLCLPNPDVTLELETALLNYVSGLDLALMITKVDAPAGSIKVANDTLELGDVLTINADENLHSFFFSEGGSFEFVIIAQGIPQVEGENYPCRLEGLITTATCDNGYIVFPDMFAGVCKVEEGTVVATEELQLGRQFDLSPNPAGDYIRLEHNLSTPIQAIEVYDSQGRMISSLDQTNSNNLEIDLSNFSPGLYWLGIQVNGRYGIKKFVRM